MKPVSTITAAIVALNEDAYITDILCDLVRQDFPHEMMEILLIDSGSDDATCAIMQEFADMNDIRGIGFRRIAVLDNPKRFQAPGWNVALREFTTDALVRIDAHAHIPDDFISSCVAVLNEGESVCGGMRSTVVPEQDRSAFAATLHVAEECAFGSSVADYRRMDEARYVNSLFHATYRREVIERVGRFDETLLRTEDNDYHYRVRSAGYRIRLDPRIHSQQYVRTSLMKMLKQKYGNGYWVGRTLFVQPRCLEWYHFAPVAFVAGMAGLAAVGAAVSWKPFAAASGAYALACTALAARAVLENDERNATMVALPFVFCAIHASYGVGTLAGLAKGAVS